MLTKKYFCQCEDAAVEVLKYDKLNLIALYILLNLSCEARMLANSRECISIEPLRSPEDYAIRIRAVSPYMGYIAWADVYESMGKTQEAEEVLTDL